MACNCNSTSNVFNNCTQCSAGLPCNCPPDYSVTALNVPCTCCPPGFYPLGNGFCCANGAVCNAAFPTNTPTIPCNKCADSVSANCVFLEPNECLGIKQPYTLTQFVDSLCTNEAFAFAILRTIGTGSVSLRRAFCQLVSVCPTIGSTTPIPGPIVVTVP